MSQRGFTLVELLVACFLLLAVTGAVVAMAIPARHAFERTLGAADLAGGSRAALEQLTADIREAGSGAAVGRLSPALADVAAVVLPLANLGGRVASPAQAIRITRIEHGAPQGIVAEPVTAGATTLRLDTSARCAATGPACGFEAGMAAIVFDRARSARITVFSIIGGDLLQLSAGLPAAFGAEAIVAAVSETTYGLRPGADGSQRLVRQTAGGAEQPVLQGVVDFEVRVRGAATGPQPAAIDDGWPDYGPAPPLMTSDDPRDIWPAGENCTIARDGAGVARARLAPLGGSVDPVALSTALLTDGPWCADDGDGAAFDADLLRVREVEVLLRVEASSARFRGPAGRLFRRPGIEDRVARWVPDVELRLVVGLRNLP